MNIIEILIKMTSGQAQAELKKLDAALDDVGENTKVAGKSLGGFGDILGTLGVSLGAGAIAAGLFQFGQASIRVASEVEESQSKFQAVFKETADATEAELSRVAGAQYEEYKAKQLQQRGFLVDHQGGNGEPDIVAKHADSGDYRVYSCKCLDFDRKTKLPIKELNPEIHAARELQGALILSVFNLHDHTEQELPLDRDKLPKKVEISPLI